MKFERSSSYIIKKFVKNHFYEGAFIIVSSQVNLACAWTGLFASLSHAAHELRTQILNLRKRVSCVPTFVCAPVERQRSCSGYPSNSVGLTLCLFVWRKMKGEDKKECDQDVLNFRSQWWYSMTMLMERCHTSSQPMGPAGLAICAILVWLGKQLCVNG